MGLAGNPLQPDILNMVSEMNGTAKLLSFLLDNLTVPPHPPEREWIQLVPQSQQKTKCKLEGEGEGGGVLHRWAKIVILIIIIRQVY